MPIDGFQNKLAKKLIELGVLPPGAEDFTINIPVEGFVTITCTFKPDERFDEAVAAVDEEKWAEICEEQQKRAGPYYYAGRKTT